MVIAEVRRSTTPSRPSSRAPTTSAHEAASVVARRAVWHRLRHHLAPAAQVWFDAHTAVIDGGVVHAGRLERWFRFFSERVLPLVQRRATIAAIVDAPDLETQRTIFYARFNHRLWRLACRAFFSQALMQRGASTAHGRLLWGLLLVDRCPGARDSLAVDEDRAMALWQHDAGFFYAGLVIATPR